MSPHNEDLAVHLTVLGEPVWFGFWLFFFCGFGAGLGFRVLVQASSLGF